MTEFTSFFILLPGEPLLDEEILLELPEDAEGKTGEEEDGGEGLLDEDMMILSSPLSSESSSSSSSSTEWWEWNNVGSCDFVPWMLKDGDDEPGAEDDFFIIFKSICGATIGINGVEKSGGVKEIRYVRYVRNEGKESVGGENNEQWKKIVQDMWGEWGWGNYNDEKGERKEVIIRSL